MTTKPIGLQLYTLREALAEDLEGTLKRVAEIGYASVEPYNGMDHTVAAPIIKDLGMAVYSLHAALPLGDDEALVLEQATAYGATQVINSGQPAEEYKTAEGVQAVIERLNKSQEVLAANGYQFGYHNHWWEFVTFDGKLAWDVLLEGLNPDVYLQIDTYWAKVGGQDPLALLKTHGERVAVPHFKDGPADSQEADMVALGDGVMPIPELVAASSAVYYIVELDRCATDMMEAVARSFAYMTEQGFAHGR